MTDNHIRRSIENAKQYLSEHPGDGGASAPTPGWLARAAQASCGATLIAMRAAELGIPLQRLEVTVDSESDDRGILGMDEAIPAGPLSRVAGTRVCAGEGARPARETSRAKTGRLVVQ